MVPKPLPNDAPFEEEIGPKASLGQAFPMEQRVRRLEDAVATLQDTRALEDRLVERVADRVVRNRNHPAPDSAGMIIEAGRVQLPAVVLTGPSVSGPAGMPLASRPSPFKRPWLLFEMLAETRAIFRMFVDPRYHLSWRGRVFPLLLVGLILSSSYWGPWTIIPVVGTVFDKVVDLILAFVLLKFLGQEARRYRETAPDLPPSLRL